MQISDFLVGKCKKLMYLKKFKVFKEEVYNFLQILAKKSLGSVGRKSQVTANTRFSFSFSFFFFGLHFFL